MKKILLCILSIISFLLSFGFNLSIAWDDWWYEWDLEEALIEWWDTTVWQTEWWKCIELNTDIPWVWKCISTDNANEALWSMMWWLMKLLLNITVAVAFIAVIASWIMVSVSWVSQSTAWKWKELLKKVVIGIILLGLSGIILHTLNPNFFKTWNIIYTIIINY